MDVLEQILETIWPGFTTLQPARPAGAAAPSALPAPAPELITLKLIRGGMPHLPVEKASEFLPHLVTVSHEFHIDTPLRVAAFLAQIAHESEELRLLHELWGPTDVQKLYDPPSHKSIELGNTDPGDGFKYRGRGGFQITGKGNYRLCGEALGVDLVENPDWAATPEGAVKVSGWFWNLRHLGPLADAKNFREITRRINGGYTGYDSRLKYFNTFLPMLGQPVV